MKNKNFQPVGTIWKSISKRRKR